ncbi:Retinitis pigmentosa 1-like 1 protein [Triplophysa tibetana]|uniref:Retinitis pigmentosa 1-like 1 protein n=1 Tax=Triplophysa tibetana TaxID=1572043 RepID=A0A5A9NHR5_9TELE|nr:Retinitis pigmentosa 1-like 1 protein [Triplophysa tibetana]
MSMLKSLWLCDPKYQNFKDQQPLDEEFKARSSSGVDVNSGSTSSGKSSVLGGAQAQTKAECEGPDTLTEVKEVDETIQEEPSETPESKCKSATPYIESRARWTPEGGAKGPVEEKLKDDVTGSDETIRNNDSPRELMETPLSSNMSSGNYPQNKETETDHPGDSSSGSRPASQRAQLSKRFSQDPDPVWVLNLLNKLEKQFMTHYVNAMDEFKVRWNLDNNEQLDIMICELKDEVRKRIQYSVNRELKKIRGRAGRPRPPKEAMSRESTVQTEQRRRRLKVMRNKSVDPQPAKSADEYTATGTDFSDQRSDDEYCPCDTCLKKKMASKPVVPVETFNSAPVMMEFDLRRILQIKKSATNNEKAESKCKISKMDDAEENVALEAVKEEDDREVTDAFTGQESEKEDHKDRKSGYCEKKEDTFEKQSDTSSKKDMNEVVEVTSSTEVVEIGEMSESNMTAEQQKEAEKENEEKGVNEAVSENSNISGSVSDAMQVETERGKTKEWAQEEQTEHNINNADESENGETVDDEFAGKEKNAKVESVDESTSEKSVEVEQTAEAETAGETEAAKDETAEEGEISEEKKTDESETAEDETAEEGEISEVKLTDESETAEDEPAEEDEISEVKMTDESETAEDEPAEEGEISEVKMTDESEIAEDEPAEEGEISEVKMTDESETAEDEPAEEGEISEVKMTDESETAEDKPPEEGDTAQDETEEEGETSEVKIAEESETAEDEPAEEGEISEVKTAEERETAEDGAAEEGVRVEDETGEEGETSEDKTAEESQAAEDEIAEKSETSEDETAEEVDISEVKTAEECETVEDETAEKSEMAEDDTAEESGTAEEKAAEDGETSQDEIAEESETAEDIAAEEGETSQDETEEESKIAEDENAENSEAAEFETAADDDLSDSKTEERSETAEDESPKKTTEDGENAESETAEEETDTKSTDNKDELVEERVIPDDKSTDDDEETDLAERADEETTESVEDVSSKAEEDLTEDEENTEEDIPESHSELEEVKETVDQKIDVLSDPDDTECDDVIDLKADKIVAEEETLFKNEGDVVIDSIDEKDQESGKEDDVEDVLGDKGCHVADSGESAEGGDEAEDDTEPDVEIDEGEHNGNIQASESTLQPKQEDGKSDKTTVTSFDVAVNQNSVYDADVEDSETEVHNQIQELSSESESKPQTTVRKTFKMLIHTLAFLKPTATQRPKVGEEEDGDDEEEHEETPEESDNTEDSSCVEKDGCGKEKGGLSDITEDTGEEENRESETGNTNKDYSEKSEWESSENALEKQFTKSSVESQPGSFDEVLDDQVKSRTISNHVTAKVNQ